MVTTRDRQPWSAVNTLCSGFPWLSENETCEAAVIGGGITGVLTTMRLAKAGVNTVLISNKPLGHCSSSESNGVLHYDGTVSLTELIDTMGRERAEETFRANTGAILAIKELVSRFPDDCGFEITDSLTFSSSGERLLGYRREAELRRELGFEVDFIRQNEGSTDFPFPMEAGIYSPGLSAVIDPFRLIQQTALLACDLGARIYEYTDIKGISAGNMGLELISCAGRRVFAKKAILATGSDTTDFLDRDLQKRTSFSVVTQPIASFEGWKNKSIIRDDDHPQVTYSITPDDRAFITGLETGLPIIGERLGGIIPMKLLSEKKYDALRNGLTRLFPSVGTLRKEHCSYGSYILPKTGEPIVGSRKDCPDCLYAFCGGNNGIVQAQLASEQIDRLIRLD
jgi:glycine/D-amino acid oxidase-like deaminating enzyme